jgi:hypothetical protein
MKVHHIEFQWYFHSKGLPLSSSAGISAALNMKDAIMMLLKKRIGTIM